MTPLWRVDHLPYGHIVNADRTATAKPVEVAYFDTEAEALAHEVAIRAGYAGGSEDARVVTWSLEVAA